MANDGQKNEYVMEIYAGGSTPGGYLRCTIREDETLESLAARYHTTPETIMSFNRNPDRDWYQPGQIICIPLG
ncbi:MAG: LysM peptidoglycan-binding domain-containing protein [Clostridiales bacterium]|nr:LysM peptidoglycan-binding domain-containing protein [Candidatus Apopatocola equi]